MSELMKVAMAGGLVVLAVALVMVTWLLGVAICSALFWVLFWLLGIEGGVEVGAVTVSYPVVCGCVVVALRMVVSAARTSK
jgi:hypothetical protein